MSGHVFHPGHSELHGITVVVETKDQSLYVGRFHEETDRGVVLHDVAVHRPGQAESPRGEFMRRTLKFGVRAEHRHLVIPAAEVGRLSKLVDWS